MSTSTAGVFKAGWQPRRLRSALVDAGRNPAIDALADRVASARVARMEDGRVGEVLRGTWFGHAIHPVLTDFAEGAWMAGSFLDLFGPRGSEDAARRLIGFGLLMAVPTAVTGIADWDPRRPEHRRVGAIHAISSTTAMALYGCSYVARRRGRLKVAVALGVAGGLVATVDGYVGGHLTLTLGSRVEGRR